MSNGKASRAYNIHDTLQDYLDRWSNDYQNVENSFNYSGVKLVDLTLPETSSTTPIIQARHAAHHAFLTDASTSRLTASIIIPTYGQSQVFSLCLESIARQTLVIRHPKTVEVIIVEGGIPPGQPKSVFDDADVQAALTNLRSLGVGLVRLYLKDNLWRAMTRNFAIGRAKNEVLFFIDNSMVLEQNFLVEHLMRHNKYDGPFALLGFKENINYDNYVKHRNEINQGKIRPDYRRDWKFSHTLKAYELPFEFKGQTYCENTKINYMEMTNNLRNVQGGEYLGKRTLPTFFQTNIVSVRRTYALKAGGFEGTLSLWGLEDSLLGARLISITKCFMVPCPSSVAFNVEIEREEPSLDEKERWLEYNRSMYANELTRKIGDRFQSALKKALKTHENLVECLEDNRARIDKKKKRSRATVPASIPQFDTERAQSVAAALIANTPESARICGRIEIRVKRHELRDIVAAVRLQANSSVISVVGDLSWIADEMPAFRVVKQQRPELRLCIFYDGAKVHRDMAPMLLELRRLGVELRPYPSEINARLRCMLIDSDNRSARRVGWISHAEIPNPAVPKDEHEFFWNMAGIGEDMLLDSIQDFAETLSQLPRPALKIGIIGVNNVGKTKFTEQLKIRLNTMMFKNRIIPDIFDHVESGTSLEANHAMLTRQLIAETAGTDFDIYLFDRTSVDNYCYFCLRAEKEILPNLQPSVIDSARSFEFLVDIHLRDDQYPGARKHVTLEQRERVRSLLNGFLQRHSIETQPVVLDSNRFDESLNSEADRIASLIHERTLIR